MSSDAKSVPDLEVLGTYAKKSLAGKSIDALYKRMILTYLLTFCTCEYRSPEGATV